MHPHIYYMIAIILGVIVAGCVAYLFGLVLTLQKRVKRLEDGAFAVFDPPKTISFSSTMGGPPDMVMRGFGVPPSAPVANHGSARINEIENEMDEINNQLSGFSGPTTPKGEERVKLEERYKFLVHEIVTELTKSVSA